MPESIITCQLCDAPVELRLDVKGRHYYRCGCGALMFTGRRLNEEEALGLYPNPTPQTTLPKRVKVEEPKPTPRREAEPVKVETKTKKRNIFGSPID